MSVCLMRMRFCVFQLICMCAAFIFQITFSYFSRAACLSGDLP